MKHGDGASSGAVEFLKRYAERRRNFDFSKKKSDAQHISGRVGADYSMLVVCAMMFQMAIRDRLAGEQQSIWTMLIMGAFIGYTVYLVLDIIRCKRGLKVLREAGVENVSQLSSASRDAAEESAP